MVNREDIRTLNGPIQDLIEAMDELEELHEQSQTDGVTVDPVAYAEAQQAVKDAVAVIVNHADDMVDRTGVLEDDEGNTLVDLPDAAMNRDGPSRDLPSGGN